jgi:PAS domain-containing protein
MSIDPRIITIPASDGAFRTHVDRIRAETAPATAEELEVRLRRLFPRAVVRERELSGEPPSWYVYRDGGWRPPEGAPWWEEPGLPRMVVSREGWIVEANETARGLLGIDRRNVGARHFTDFVAPGTLDDALALFKIVDEGNELTATVLLRPTSGDVVAVDLQAKREGDAIVSVLRLADDVEVPRATGSIERPDEVVSIPESDWAFRGYVQLAMSRMPEPTPDGLALRLRRLYPHARVTANGPRWVAEREVQGAATSAASWWEDPALPSVRYDSQALILEANEAARSLLGRDLVGHHWQEFVTPGSTEQVSAMLAILAEVGRAESRFRMPRVDGSLIEFDSYTEVQGETFTTVMRRRNEPETSDA